MKQCVDFISGRKTSDLFGISRYANELERHMQSFEYHRIEYPSLSHNQFFDGAVREFLYPLIIKAKSRKYAIKHITSQHLASLQNFFGWENCIITCHDLIPWCYEKNRSFQWKLNMKGLKKASIIITDSDFSRKEILREIGVSKEKVYTIPLGVDHDRYYPVQNAFVLKKKLGLTDEWPIILYVGSEEPRKNLQNLLLSLALIKADFPRFKFIKAGESQYGGERDQLENVLKSLELEKNVLFTGKIVEKDLPLLYNLADVFVFPSFYEGFGFPPLEAMACGCPVVVSACTSLPEIVGDAGCYIKPDNPRSISLGITTVLTDDCYRNNLVQKGILQSQKFTWQKTAIETENVYRQIGSSL